MLLFTSAIHPPGSLILLGWGSVTEQEEDPVESVYYRAAKNVRHILIRYFTLTVSGKIVQIKEQRVNIKNMDGLAFGLQKRILQTVEKPLWWW